jgi:drug/metabolite transporter (DMT)-like permease
VFLIGRIYYAYAFILAFFLLKEKPSKLQCLFLVTLVIGIFLSEWQSKWPEDFESTLLLAIIWPFCFALQHAIVKFIVSTTTESSTQLLIKSRLLSIVPLVIYLFYRAPNIQNIIPMDFLWLSLSTYFSIFLSTMLLFYSFKSISFVTANMIRCCQPLGVLLISSIFFPKKIETIHILGFMIIVASIIMFGLSSEKKEA